MEFSLLVKKLKDQLTPEEELQFQTWYNEAPRHRAYFDRVDKEFKGRQHLKKESFLEEPINDQKAWAQIRSKMHPDFRSRGYLPVRYLVAAIVLLALVTNFFLQFQNQELSPTTAQTQKAHSIILTSEDGAAWELEDETQVEHEYFTGSARGLVYDEASENDIQPPKNLVYNTLLIPRGKQFLLQLSDHTKVWLNADSKLRFPVRFLEGGPRRVELIYGEAFFEVSPSLQHNGNTFQVVSGTQTIEVLGTQFNLRAYPEDEIIKTSLTEGSIMLTNSLNPVKRLLEPGHEGNFDPATGRWEVSEMGLENVMAWREGIFSFKEESLETIMLSLARWYDLEVTFTADHLRELKFNGVFRKSQQLENILDILQQTGEMKYDRIGNNIVLHPQ